MDRYILALFGLDLFISLIYWFSFKTNACFDLPIEGRNIIEGNIPAKSATTCSASLLVNVYVFGKFPKNLQNKELKIWLYCFNPTKE